MIISSETIVQTITYIVQMTLLKSSTTITHEPRQRTIEILPSGVGDFPVLHFLLVFDFISHFYQLFLVSCLFVNSASCKQCELFPLHVNQNSSSVFLCIA